MSQRKIGLRLDSLRGRPREVIALAAELEMEGIEINCMEGEFTPAELDRQARKEVVHFLEDLQLELVSLGADTGFRFEDESRIEEFVDKTREALDLALDLKSPLITMAIGGLPEDKESERYELISKVMKELGDDAANRELAIALSAGMESPVSLSEFLNELDNDGLKVNYDPANMIVFGYDPAEAVATLGPHIVSVRARDAGNIWTVLLRSFLSARVMFRSMMWSMLWMRSNMKVFFLSPGHLRRNSGKRLKRRVIF